MRKVLSIVLALAMILGSFAFSFAATASDVVGEDCEDAVNVLTELGVVSGYPDGSFKPAGIVTRGEMAKIIICALGLEDYAAGSSSFSDMAGHWADKYVAYAVSLGIINGYPDNTFKANNTVSYDEAAKMLVAALGYTEDSLVGAWPVNWVTKAKVLGILDGISAGSAGANRGDIAIMAFQSLDIEMGKVNKDGDFVTTLVSSGNSDTMMTRLDATLYDPAGAPVAGASFVLTDGIADAAVADIRDVVGAYVTAYANSDNEIIAIKEVKSVFLTGDFDLNTATGALLLATDDFETDDNNYDVNSATIDTDNITSFVNGASIGTGKAIVAGTEYTIAAEVSGLKITDVYSISDWNISDHFMFDDGDLESDNLAGNDFVLDDNNNIDSSKYDIVGADSIEDIEEDDVVYVYNNAAGISRIEVGTEVVEGTVTRVAGSVPLTATYTIGGAAYDIASQRAGGFTVGNLSIDNEVKVWLDYNGEIYAEDLLDGQADMYAVVLGGINPADGINDDKVKLFLADGTEKTFIVDITGYTFGRAGVDTCEINDLIEYGLNSDGEIDGITRVTPVNAGADNTITAAGYHANYKVAADALVLINADITAAAFAIAAGSTEYDVTTLADVIDSAYTDILYVTNSDDEIEVLVVEGAGAVGDEVYGVLNGVFANSDVDDGAIIMVDGIDTEYSADAAVVEANDAYLYEIVTKTNGEVTLDYLDVIADAEMVDDGALTYWTGVYAENSRLKNTATLNVAYASDVVVYSYDAVDGWTEADVNDIEIADKVTLYATDMIDNPSLVTFVLINGADTTAATVTTGMTAAGAATLTVGAHTLVFSESISAASMTAIQTLVQTAVTVGAASTVTYAWNAAHTTLTLNVAGAASGIGALANTAVTDIAGNTSAALDLQL